VTRLQKREVVVTGVGVVSPLGVGKQKFWEALAAGESGVRHREAFPDHSWAFNLAAEIKDFDPKQYVKPRKALKVMCRAIQAGYSSSVLAMQDAGLEKGDIEPSRIGVVFGGELYYCDLDELEDTYSGCMVDGEFTFDNWAESAMKNLYPLWMLKHLPNMTACHVGIAYDAQGPCNTITLGEVSGSLSFIEGASIIERGRTDVMIIGGSGSRANVTPMVYRGDVLLSHRTDDPAGACRPFDADRDGCVIGEGAGSIVLEAKEHAEARSAPILARVLGFGRTQQGVNETLTDPIRRSIEVALKDAGLNPSDVEHVNAHGLATIEQDQHEAQAIRAALGDCLVTAPKSYFGNLGAGAAPIEMAASIVGFEHGLIPQTLNYETPDPNCPVNVVAGEPRRQKKGVAIVLNQTYTGQSSAIVLGAP